MINKNRFDFLFKQKSSNNASNTSTSISNQWQQEEDTKLIDLVNQNGSLGKWYK